MPRSTIEYDDPPADVMKRLVAGSRRGTEKAAEFWDDKILPDHFEDAAFDTYHYTPRAGQGEPAYVPSVKGIVLMGGKTKYGAQRVKQNRKYYHDKQRRGFGKTALVYSEGLKHEAIGSGRVTTRQKARTVEATDTMRVPRYAYERPRSSRVDKVAEMTRTTVSEDNKLGAIVETTAALEISRRGRRRIVTK